MKMIIIMIHHICLVYQKKFQQIQHIHFRVLLHHQIQVVVIITVIQQALKDTKQIILFKKM